MIAFIDKHIVEFNGKNENKHGIPQMLFEKKQDAQRFANDIVQDLISPENILR